MFSFSEGMDNATGIIRIESLEVRFLTDPDARTGRTIKDSTGRGRAFHNLSLAKKKDWKCGCGAENFKFRDNCLKCGGPRPSLKIETDHGNDTARIDAGSTEERWGHDGFRENEKGTSPSKSEAWEGAAFKAVANADDDDDAIIRELKARKEVAMARARAAAQGLPIPGSSKDGAPGREAKRAKKEKKSKKEKKEKKSRKERHSSSSEEGAIRE